MSSKLRYAKKIQFKQTENGHSEGVSALAFNRTGDHLATAGFDCKVCIWRVDDGRLMHTFVGNSAVLALVWLPDDSHTVVCGAQDGIITAVRVTPVRVMGCRDYFHKNVLCPE